ncbi:MAG: hypothetical protein V1664_00220 [Candidatus Uhrbacteria bacterium]
MSIIISQDGKKAQRVEKAEFEKEGYLQNYIHENPESIPVYEIDEDKKLFVVAREFRTESGPIDALAIDKDGDIYVVETKLFKNPDKRTVVAQALDYGASLWRHSDFGEFMNRINDEVNKKFHVSFEDKIKEFFETDDEQMEIIIEAMKTNLHDGNIKFVILMDSITDPLKDLIVYINQNSQFDIFAVQMEYYKHDGYEIMIPKLFGVEVKKNIGNKIYSNARTMWDEQSFIAQAKEKLKEDADKIIDLYSYLKNNAGSINWGTGNANSSFAPMIEKISKTLSPFSIYSNGTILVKFNWLNNHLEKQIFNKYLDAFIEELLKTKINITREKLLTEKFYIEPKEFLENSEGITQAIKKIINKEDVN